MWLLLLSYSLCPNTIIRNAMPEAESTGQRGLVDTRNDQNVLKAEKLRIVSIPITKRDRAVVTAKREYEVIGVWSWS